MFCFGPNLLVQALVFDLDQAKQQTKNTEFPFDDFLKVDKTYVCDEISKCNVPVITT